MKERLNKIDKGLMLKFSGCPHREDRTLGHFYEIIVPLLIDKDVTSCHSGGINISRPLDGKGIDINGKLIYLSKKEKARIISVHRTMWKAIQKSEWGDWKKLYNLFDVAVKS